MLTDTSLPHASEGWGKVMFSQVCVRSQGGGGLPQYGVPPGQVSMGYSPGQVRMGYPHPGWGTPIRSGWGYPPPQAGLDRVPPWPGQDGVPPPRQGWIGYPPGQVRMGSPPQPGLGSSPPPPAQNSRVSTCSTAGGMPLAVTQGTFLFI